jgi:hypothetical protein
MKEGREDGEAAKVVGWCRARVGVQLPMDEGEDVGEEREERRETGTIAAADAAVQVVQLQDECHCQDCRDQPQESCLWTDDQRRRQNGGREDQQKHQSRSCGRAQGGIIRQRRAMRASRGGRKAQ